MNVGFERVTTLQETQGCGISPFELLKTVKHESHAGSYYGAAVPTCLAKICKFLGCEVDPTITMIRQIPLKIRETMAERTEYRVYVKEAFMGPEFGKQCQGNHVMLTGNRHWEPVLLADLVGPDPCGHDQFTWFSVTLHEFFVSASLSWGWDVNYYSASSPAVHGSAKPALTAVAVSDGSLAPSLTVESRLFGLMDMFPSTEPAVHNANKWFEKLSGGCSAEGLTSRAEAVAVAEIGDSGLDACSVTGGRRAGQILCIYADILSAWRSASLRQTRDQRVVTNPWFENVYTEGVLHTTLQVVASAPLQFLEAVHVVVVGPADCKYVGPSDLLPIFPKLETLRVVCLATRGAYSRAKLLVAVGDDPDRGVRLTCEEYTGAETTREKEMYSVCGAHASSRFIAATSGALAMLRTPRPIVGTSASLSIGSTLGLSGSFANPDVAAPAGQPEVFAGLVGERASSDCGQRKDSAVPRRASSWADCLLTPEGSVTTNAVAGDCLAGGFVPRAETVCSRPGLVLRAQRGRRAATPGKGRVTRVRLASDVRPAGGAAGVRKGISGESRMICESVRGLRKRMKGVVFSQWVDEYAFGSSSVGSICGCG